MTLRFADGDERIDHHLSKYCVRQIGKGCKTMHNGAWSLVFRSKMGVRRGMMQEIYAKGARNGALES